MENKLQELEEKAKNYTSKGTKQCWRCVNRCGSACFADEKGKLVRVPQCEKYDCYIVETDDPCPDYKRKR